MYEIMGKLCLGCIESWEKVEPSHNSSLPSSFARDFAIMLGDSRVLF